MARPNASANRIFPPPQRLLDADTPWARLARSPYAWIGQWSDSQRLRGLIWLAIAASREESHGALTKADFYWNDLRRGAQRFLRRPAQAGAAILRAIAASEPSSHSGLSQDQAMQHFVDEILIDTHIAFFNSAHKLGTPTSISRSNFHLAQTRSWLLYSGMTAAQRSMTTRSATMAMAELARVAERWDELAALCKAQLALDPDDEECQAELVDALWSQGATHAQVFKGDTLAQPLVKALAPILAELKGIAAKMPELAPTYDALAELHQIRAIALANAGELPDALVEIEWALAASPDSESAQGIREQLQTAMQDLQKHVSQIEDELRSKPGMGLNEQGLRLKRQSDVGFAPANEFLQSAEAHQLGALASTARRKRFWRRIGLFWPATGGDAIHERLIFAMSNVLSASPDSPEEVTSAWNAEAAGDPDLLMLDARGICGFLTARARDEPWPDASIRPPDIPIATTDVLYMPYHAPGTSKGRISFGEWLRSRQDTGLKVRFAAIAALLALTYGVLHHERNLFADRSSALASLRKAAAEGDDAQVLRYAGDFLQARPATSDPRVPVVTEAYRSALVNWTANQESWGAEQQSVIDRYRRLVGHSQEAQP